MSPDTPLMDARAWAERHAQAAISTSRSVSELLDIDRQIAELTALKARKEEEVERSKREATDAEERRLFSEATEKAQASFRSSIPNQIISALAKEAEADKNLAGIISRIASGSNELSDLDRIQTTFLQYASADRRVFLFDVACKVSAAIGPSSRNLLSNMPLKDVDLRVKSEGIQLSLNSVPGPLSLENASRQPVPNLVKAAAIAQPLVASRQASRTLVQQAANAVSQDEVCPPPSTEGGLKPNQAEQATGPGKPASKEPDAFDSASNTPAAGTSSLQANLRASFKSGQPTDSLPEHREISTESTASQQLEPSAPVAPSRTKSQTKKRKRDSAQDTSSTGGSSTTKPVVKRAKKVAQLIIDFEESLAQLHNRHGIANFNPPTTSSPLALRLSCTKCLSSPPNESRLTRCGHLYCMRCLKAMQKLQGITKDMGKGREVYMTKCVALEHKGTSVEVGKLTIVSQEIVNRWTGRFLGTTNGNNEDGNTGNGVGNVSLTDLVVGATGEEIAESIEAEQSGAEEKENTVGEEGPDVDEKGTTVDRRRRS